jgi:hypothetical protein
MPGKPDLSDFLTNDCPKSAFADFGRTEAGLARLRCCRFHSQGSAQPVRNSG